MCILVSQAHDVYEVLTRSGSVETEAYGHEMTFRGRRDIAVL